MSAVVKAKAQAKRLIHRIRKRDGQDSKQMEERISRPVTASTEDILYYDKESDDEGNLKLKTFPLSY